MLLGRVAVVLLRFVPRGPGVVLPRCPRWPVPVANHATRRLPLRALFDGHHPVLPLARVLPKAHVRLVVAHVFFFVAHPAAGRPQRGRQTPNVNLRGPGGVQCIRDGEIEPYRYQFLMHRAHVTQHLAMPNRPFCARMARARTP